MFWGYVIVGYLAAVVLLGGYYFSLRQTRAKLEKAVPPERRNFLD